MHIQPHHAEDKIYDGYRITRNKVLIHQKFWNHMEKFHVKHPPYLWIKDFFLKKSLCEFYVIYDDITRVMPSDS